MLFRPHGIWGQIAFVSASFVHLRVHSEFSLADGIVRIPDLVAAAAAASMPAVALTDLCNVFGADVWVAHPSDPHKPLRLTLLCQGVAGYRNLSRLLTAAYREGQKSGRPCLERAWLDEASAGLIA